MKFAVAVLIFIWLLCGGIGAWWTGDLDSADWKTIARGPITLAQALNDDPVSYPGPN